MQILQTQDYDLFKRLPGNRQLQKPHLNRLKESIAQDSRLTKFNPILVNQSMEVIDGQNRLEVLKELELPVYYIKGDGLALEDVQTLNTVTKTWTPIDYAKSYIELGNKHYQYYLDIRTKYHLPHKVVLTYLALSQNSRQTAEFKEGRLVVDNLRLTQHYLDQLVDVGAYYPRYSTAAFANAFLKLAQHPDYDHKRMLAKMRLRGHLIEDYSLSEDYQRALEAAYNYHMSKDRVRFF